jgi:hypothetical protein
MHYDNTINTYILSNKLSYRLKRHITFWVTIILFFTAQRCFENYQFEKKVFDNVLVALKFIPSKIFLTDILFCYPVIYLLIPKLFLKKRYFLFVLSCAIISVIIFIIYSFYIYYHFHLTPDRRFRIIWGGIIDFIFVGPFAVCGLFLAIKMLKKWYLREEEKQMLLTANTNAESQLLKAQLHPHFLFNTLNNIYSFAFTKSTQAAQLVMNLSNTLQYMIVDCGADMVLLSKELKMINDYIHLERVRYSDLEIQIEISGELKNKKIVPLLMIPFVENSFKHGTSKMLRKSWIKLFIQTDKDVLRFSLINSKPSGENINGKKTCLPDRQGIGLLNVKKRLELLYPQNHSLLIESTESTFTVDMQIPLEKIQNEIVA